MTQAFLLAVVLAFLIPFFHRIGMRRFGCDRAIFAMFLTLGAYVALWGLAYALLNRFEIQSFLGGLFFTGFVSLSYIEFFSMLCRGFSLTILVDLADKPAQTEEEIIANYGGGKSADWLFTKRLKSLQKMGWIDTDETSLWLTHNAAFVAGRLGAIFKSTLRLSGGG